MPADIAEERSATRRRRNLNTKDNDIVSLSSGGIINNSASSYKNRHSSTELTTEEEALWLQNLNRRLEVLLLVQKNVSRGTLNAVTDSKQEDISYRNELTHLAEESSVVVVQQQNEIQLLTQQLTAHDNEILELRTTNEVLQQQLRETDNTYVSLQNENPRYWRNMMKTNKGKKVLDGRGVGRERG